MAAIDWPPELIDDIARRRCVLFLGAGVSKNSSNAKGERPKDWKEFLAAAAALLKDPRHAAAVNECISQGDLLTGCELLKKFLRGDRFTSYLLEEYSNKAFKPVPIHDHIIALDSRIVMTTNFDKLYENRANQVQQNTILVKTYYDQDVADSLRRAERTVVKVHGTIDSVIKTIFTRKEYALARTQFSPFYRIVEALFLTHTFVFLGASMRDPDMQLLLEDYNYRFTGTRPHFMVMPKDDKVAPILEVIEESMNVRPLIYDPIDNHRELSESLEQARDLVLQAREALVRTQNW
jgi:hypothetical protein